MGSINRHCQVWDYTISNLGILDYRQAKLDEAEMREFTEKERREGGRGRIGMERRVGSSRIS